MTPDSNIKFLIDNLKKITTNDSNNDTYENMIQNMDDPKLYKKYRDRLINNNVRLVIQKVMEYVRNTKLMTFDDLVQEGIIGLIKSIETYNPSLNYNFTTWASVNIKKYILRYLDSLYMPKPHTQITENIDRVRRIQNKLVHKIGRPPSAEEVKDELDKEMKTKSAKNKILNKERLKKGLSPFSENIGVDKKGKFVGINIKNIKYIIENINNNNIMHSINIETRDVISVDNQIDNIEVNSQIVGSITFNKMQDDIDHILDALPIKYAEIIDMLLGINYDRPYSYEEIKTVLYNNETHTNHESIIPHYNRMMKFIFEEMKE